MLLNTDLVSLNFILGLGCVLGELYQNCGEENITGSEIYIENIMKNQQTYYLEDDNEVKLVMSMLIDYVFINKETAITTDEIIDAYEFDCYTDSGEILTKYYNNNDIKCEMEWFEREASQRTDYTKVVSDAFDDILIKYRNELWIPKMEYIINNHYNDNILFAVGALHLFDLVERLRLRGYKVSALNVY